MTVSDAKRLKALEEDNTKLKTLLAEQLLDAAAMKEPLAKKVRPSVKRDARAHLQSEPGLSERRACCLVGTDRKMIRYQSKRPPETELRQRMRDLANERRRFRFLRLFVLLRRDCEPSGINLICWLAERPHTGEHQAVSMSCCGKALDSENAISVVDNGRHVQILVGIDEMVSVRERGVISAPLTV